MNNPQNRTKKANSKKQPPLPTGVPMLELFQQKTFSDVYEDYISEINRQHDQKRAYGIQAKLKTALRRYTLPGFGWDSTQKTVTWLSFMQTLSLQDIARALEVQEHVYSQFGEALTDTIRRTNRSSLKQFVEYAQAKLYYHTAVGKKEEQVAPRMHTHKKRQEHWHRLKPKDIPRQVKNELDRLQHYLLHQRSQTPYSKNLEESTVKRYLREALDMLSWLYRFKGVPLESLSIERLVPRVAIFDAGEAAKVGHLLREYLEWLKSELGLARRGLSFAARSCSYIAELLEYEQVKGI